MASSVSDQEFKKAIESKRNEYLTNKLLQHTAHHKI